MLLTEWNLEDALEVRGREAWEDGRTEGRMEGRTEGRAEVARKAFDKGLPLTVISEITGLDTQTITQLTGK